MKRLSALLGSINSSRRIGRGDPVIGGISYDSRRVKENDIFFALGGVHTDGHRYVQDAVARGAKAVVLTRELSEYDPEVMYLLVEDARTALSSVSAAFYDDPSREMVVIGVTGTDGKSTTVFLIHQLLTLAGRRSGFISTVEFQTGASAVKNPLRQSTPEASEIHSILAEMRDAGKRFAVIESTSHGLSEKTSRLADVPFDVAVLTNVTHEHLEFHGTIENYRHDKANLFRTLDRTAASGKPGSLYRSLSVSVPDADRSVPGTDGISLFMPFGVVNADDPHCGYFREATSRPTVRYSLTDSAAELSARIHSADLSETEFSLFERGNELGRYTLRIPGAYNVENAMAALLAVSGATGTPVRELAPYLGSLKGVIGRMYPVRRGQPFSVLVDYAHTPGSFERVLPFARRYTKGKVIAVFGSGGERDREKRPIQGSLAAKYCDMLVLADEDPRLEDRMKILEEIAAGARASGNDREVLLIPDRREAIRTAFRAASPGDSVLLLGKGHEASIILADGPIPWNEAAVAGEELSRLGYSEKDDE
jgi:UDP-N-acetylmuramoyl-L-alanyl-D-glutamate--2,6-diaminopimelate ligase